MSSSPFIDISDRHCIVRVGGRSQKVHVPHHVKILIRRLNFEIVVNGAASSHSSIFLFAHRKHRMPEYIAPYRAVAASTSNGHSASNGVGSIGIPSSSSTSGKTILIDNYDSFTYNVVEVSHDRCSRISKSANAALWCSICQRWVRILSSTEMTKSLWKN